MKFLILFLFPLFLISQVNIGLNADVTEQSLTSFNVSPVIDYSANKSVYSGSFKYVKQSINNVNTEKYFNLNLAYRYFFKPQIYFGAYTGLNTKYVNTLGLHTGIVRKFYNHLLGEFKVYGEHRSHLKSRSLESGVSFILQLRI